MEADDVAHCETKSASNGHGNPELGGVEEGEVSKRAEFTSDNHQWEEDQTSVDVVVVRQLPDVLIDLKTHVNADISFERLPLARLSW